MSDNTTLNAGAGGDVIATDDVTSLNGSPSSGVKVQRVKVMHGLEGEAFDSSHEDPLPIQPAAAYYVAATGNSTTSQLTAGSTFTGSIEDVLSQPSVSILITCDQPCTLTINQYIDGSGVYKASTHTYTLTANQNFARSFTINANYFNLTLQNTGAASTTTLNINTYYGTIATAGQAPAAVAMPVVMAIDQTPIPMKITDGTNTIGVDQINNDSVSVSEYALPTEGYNMVFNGTTWDRLRGDTTAGAWVQLKSALPAGTNFIGKVDLTDGTNEAVIDTTASDGESATTASLVTNGRMKGFNGSTWDRVRSTSTTFKCATYTSAQTGTALWTPAAGKAVVITSIQIQSYGTTAGTCIVWFGASADTTYTRGTDAPVFDGEFVPTATNKPGFAMTYPVGQRGTADYVLRVTTTNAQSVTVNVWGYEI